MGPFIINVVIRGRGGSKKWWLFMTSGGVHFEHPSRQRHSASDTNMECNFRTLSAWLNPMAWQKLHETYSSNLTKTAVSYYAINRILWHSLSSMCTYHTPSPYSTFILPPAPHSNARPLIFWFHNKSTEYWV